MPSLGHGCGVFAPVVSANGQQHKRNQRSALRWKIIALFLNVAACSAVNAQSDYPADELMPWRKIGVLNNPNTQLLIQGANGETHTIRGGTRLPVVIHDLYRWYCGSDMTMEMQPYLLRVLEDRAVSRLGESRRRPIDVRIIAATNRSLSLRDLDPARDRPWSSMVKSKALPGHQHR